MTFLKARDVVKSYGRTPALRGITLDVAPGETVAVTGPSGCGKSTLLHCLAGILRPDAGEVRYGERRLDDLSEAERSRLRRTEFGVAVPVRAARHRTDRRGERRPAAAARRPEPA